MQFKTIKTIALTFIISSFFSNIQPNINFLNIDKINEYKKEISNEIFRAKCFRFAALGAVSAIVWKSLFPNNTSSIKLDPNDFDEKKLKTLNDLLESFAKGKVIIIDDLSNVHGWELIKKQLGRFIVGVKSITKSIVSSAPLVLSQFYMEPFIKWLLLHYNLKFFVEKNNIINLLSELKLYAVNLDPQSPILDNQLTFANELQADGAPFSFYNLDEFIKLKIHAKAILLSKEFNISTEEQVKQFECCSNNLINALSKIIAYLMYQEEILCSNQAPDAQKKGKDISQCITRLTSLTNTYCTEVKNIMTNIYSKDPSYSLMVNGEAKVYNSNKSMLAAVFKFVNLFNQIIASAVKSNC